MGEGLGVESPRGRVSAQLGLDQESYAGVARYRRDLGSTSYVGGLVTSRTGDGYHNLVGGVDAVIQLNPSNGIRVQYLRSDTEYPDQTAIDFGQPLDSFDGHAAFVSYDYDSREWF